MPSRNIIKFQLKVTVKRLWNEERPIEQISKIFDISRQRIIFIAGQTRLVTLYLFNKCWTDLMFATTLSLTVETVSIVRWTLRNVISVRGEPGHGQHGNQVVEE